MAVVDIIDYGYVLLVVTVIFLTAGNPFRGDAQSLRGWFRGDAQSLRGCHHRSVMWRSPELVSSALSRHIVGT